MVPVIRGLPVATFTHPGSHFGNVGRKGPSFSYVFLLVTSLYGLKPVLAAIEAARHREELPQRSDGFLYPNRRWFVATRRRR